MPIRKVVSSMPRPSLVRMCTAAGVNMTKKLYTAANGRFSTKVCMKQPTSRAYGYQVQYRVQCRYTLANETAKGATWTAKSAWKNDRAFTVGGTTYPVGSTYDADNWGVCNIGVNKSSVYHAFDTFNNSYVGGDYDAKWYQYRIRAFSKNGQTASPWYISDGLYIYKSADVRDVTLYRGADGGLVVRFNYNFDRGATFVLTSFRKVGEQRGGIAADLGSVSYAINTDNGRGSLLPATRTGYVPGVVRVPLGKVFKMPLELGEQYELLGYVRTTDGAVTHIDGTYTVQLYDLQINPPVITVTDNGQQFGVPKVVATRSDTADVVTKWGCVGTYVSMGDTRFNDRVTIQPTKVTQYNAGSANWRVEFEFANAPVDTDIKFTVTFSNADNSAASADATYQNNVTPGVWYLNKADDFGKRATLQYNIKFSEKTAKPYTMEQPHGRLRPWVAFGVGSKTNLTLSGTIAGDDDRPADMLESSVYSWWEWIRRNQGVYWLRAPKGRIYRVALTNVSIQAASDHFYDLSLEMVEVD